MHRAFISVAHEDIEFATAVKNEFLASLLYLYTDSGRDGADMWQEEEAALRASSVMVIFWSRHYLRKRGTLREIRLAVELLGQRRLGHPLIVRLDDTPLDAAGTLDGDASNGVRLLAPLIERWRALPLPFDKNATVYHLESLLVADSTVSPPEHQRPQSLQRFALSGSIGPREVRPIFWVHGHEGYGRRFLIEKYMRQFDPNSKRVEISLVDSEGPLTMLLRLRSYWSSAAKPDFDSLIEASPDGHGDARQITAIVDTFEEIAAGGGHVIVTFEALNRDAGRWIPEWILRLVEAVTIGRRPKVFFVSQFSFPQGLLKRALLGQRLAPVSVNSLEFDESKEYGYRLTGFFDVNPERWSTADIEKLADDAEGTIFLLISIARMRASTIDLRAQSSTPYEMEAHFTAKLNRYLDACVENLRTLRDAFPLLRTITDLQLISFSDLKIMYPNADLPGLLGHMLDMGVVETPVDSLYRIPRIVLRRLDSRLDLRNALSSDSLTQQDRYRRLLERPLDSEREPVFAGIEARVRSQLALDPADENHPYSKFVTASYLMQSGIQAYDRQDHSVALRLFQSCVRLLKEIPEANTRCVMLRYYGLAAAREGDGKETQRAVELLRAEGARGASRINRVNPDADAEFVQGFACRLDERWSDAIKHYSRSLTRLELDGSSRVSDCHRELADCYLHERPANFRDARFHAQAAYESRDNIMSLDILVKALIQSCWYDEKLTTAEHDRLSSQLDRYLEELEVVSNRLGRGMWQQRKAEDLLMSDKPEDVALALRYAEQALVISPRQDFHPLVWKILLSMSTEDSLGDLVKRTADAIANTRFNARTRSVAARYAIAAHIMLGERSTAQSLFNRHKSGFPYASIKAIQSAIDKSDLGGADWVS